MVRELFRTRPRSSKRKDAKAHEDRGDAAGDVPVRAKTEPRKKARRQPREASPSVKGFRSCLGCREHFLREDLIRVVCDPEGEVVVDRYLKAPGRGAHLCYAVGCIEEAIKRKAFARAFKRPVHAVEAKALIATVETAIVARIVDALALGRRAGQTVSGTDVLERNMSRMCGLVIATDAAPATEEKLRRQAEVHECPVWRFGESESLGVTQGKLRRVAIGIVDRGLAQRLAIEFLRRDRVSVAA